jgi:NADPH:quinone reductase-like Zn-dependent oxidoreductase
VRDLAPDGVAAVFDHVKGPGIDASWRMLARGGALVSYGTASTKDVAGDPQVPVLKLLAKSTVPNPLPDEKSAPPSSTCGPAVVSTRRVSARKCRWR